ncbi:tetratricopeptide repeat protein [Bradyrhizobium cenepequi]|uniref:tetratricopeptide repeat protein n=1 Tax=Bradyrhizobium cenepequi TaxID=2821403 RepID=UPI001CE243EF|nr:tetratricopeptide repeat protein [Bradyrhizobium cenepequi]MCA6111676.1 SEL1-like repeat protein [Bradyrhizobium cenepequi]
MNSRASWSVDGIDPSVRERAEDAARRAGMTLNDWLNSTIGEPAPPDSRTAPSRPAVSSQASVADIHQRLDAITQQIDRLSQPAPRNDAPRSDTARGQSNVARQLNDAISRLDARLSQISNPAAVRQPQVPDRQRQAEAVERAAAKVYRPSPPLSPASFDSAIAEIAARQNELDGPPQRPMPPRHAQPMDSGVPPMAAHAPPVAPPPAAPAPAGPDFSSLERYLVKITSQIEALQRPDHVEQSIAAFRSELAEIRAAITEALPRRAIESLESEIRSLSRRIDDNRQNGADSQALTGIERALSEIREVLRSLTPAEQLAGYDEAIRNLGAKLDLILRTNDDPSTVQQLESAIGALRTIVSNIASNDALARLTEDVQTLSAKVDELARAGNHGDAFAVLEQRIAALASTLESRERPAPTEHSQHLEEAVRALSERIDRMQVGNDSASAFAHLEQRVSYLLERLETSSNPQSGNFSRVEEGLQDILRHLERQHANLVSLAEANRIVGAPAPQSLDPDIVDLVKRELSDIRFSQSETDRRTQDSLETVHNTLGHVVDRLAMIENDLRTVRSVPAAPAPSPEPPRAAMPQAMVPQPKPELPNPAAQQRFTAEEHFAAAPRDFHAATPAEEALVPPPLPPRAISEILEPHAAVRAALAPDLPPDHPLEPGTRPSGRVSTPTERIAASESAISEISPAKKEPVSTSSFIAAARRAAQAAAAQAATEKGGRSGAKAATRAKPADKAQGKSEGKEPSTITSKIRSLLVGASVVVIVLGAFKVTMILLDSGTGSQMPPMERSSDAPAAAQPPADSAAVAPVPAPAPAAPLMTSPTPLGRQSNNSTAPNTLDGTQVAIPPGPAPSPSPVASNDITGSIPAPMGSRLRMVQVPPSERLPDAIGGPVLRAAALRGDPAAAYEVGVRFAEGKGVPTNYDEAAKWYERAAQAGVVPAIFRLGTFYEKGLSVKKDVDTARRYYVQAAERGNAKAMHNLAVLDADGGGKGADYKSAAQWFRKAADHGVADSQFNLGILYARGIGVEQNLAESFKWFSLAAAQGDADAGRKRDDVAKRLDAQSLAAAKLAIQTFTAEPQPDNAVNAATPPGGWDSATVKPNAAKPAARATSPKRTASVAH